MQNIYIEKLINFHFYDSCITILKISLILPVILIVTFKNTYVNANLHGHLSAVT